jgi:hypothetical protein
MNRLGYDDLKQPDGPSTHGGHLRQFPDTYNDDERLILRQIQQVDEIIFDRIAGETRHDDDDHRDKAKVEPDARERLRQELERGGPMQPGDVETQKLRDRVDDLARQALANNGRCDTATETITAPTRTFAQAVVAPSESGTGRDIKKEKTTSGSSRRVIQGCD